MLSFVSGSLAQLQVREMFIKFAAGTQGQRMYRPASGARPVLPGDLRVPPGRRTGPGALLGAARPLWFIWGSSCCACFDCRVLGHTTPAPLQELLCVSAPLSKLERAVKNAAANPLGQLDDSRRKRACPSLRFPQSRHETGRPGSPHPLVTASTASRGPKTEVGNPEHLPPTPGHQGQRF